METALRVESELGVRLTRSTNPAKADRVPIDVSRFTPAQVHLIQQFILDLGPRVLLVGM
jgi:hypothetical protein